MASQIYSRYVPPKKKPSIVPISHSAPTFSSTNSPSSVQPLQTNRPVTKPDASATYARYIPPSSKTKPAPGKAGVPPISDANASPKRKRESKDDGTSQKELSRKSKRSNEESIPDLTPSRTQATSVVQLDIPHDAAAGNEPQSERRKRQKRKNDSEKKSRESIETTKLDEEDPRHKTILLKRNKSLKKAEKLARKAEQKAAGKGEPGTDEAVVPEELPELHALDPLPQPEPKPEPLGKPTFSALPPWLASPIRVSPDAIASFARLGMEKGVIEALQSKGFEHAFAVQAAVLPLLLPSDQHQRGDVLVSAATGSGKTLAYVLPMLEDISRSIITRVRGLIVMPTRELVNQAREVCEVCATAFASNGRKRVKIGVAVGNQTFKTNQTSLIYEELQYDPDEYRKREKRANSKWDLSGQETDEEDLDLFGEPISPTLPNHIIEYTSKVDVLICTPGRLVEHIKSTPGFTLKFIKWFVIDEADKLLDQSFQQWLETVMAGLTSESSLTTIRKERRSETPVTKVVLSATVTRDIGQLSSLKLHRPKLVVLEGDDQIGNEATDTKSDLVYNLPGSLQESAVKVENDSKKPLYLLQLLKIYEMLGKAAEELKDDTSENSSTSSSEDESSSGESDTSEYSTNSSKAASDVGESEPPPQVDSPSDPRGVLIFTRSNENAVRLSRLLTLLDPAFSDIVGTLTSAIRNSIRRRTLQDFRRGRLSVIVASDLVARGLDIQNLAHVINYDIPTSLTSYIHRVGRTARAGRQGHAWTLVSNTEARWFWNEIARSQFVQRAGGKKVERAKIDAASFGVERRGQYEEALAALGQEAHGSRYERSSAKK
jgi:ATP-dependent RNA helicase DDX51/DBP6